MCTVVPTVNMLMQHIFILCSWRPEEGIRCLELDLQMLMSYHLGIDPKSSGRVASALSCTIFPASALPTFFCLFVCWFF